MEEAFRTYLLAYSGMSALVGTRIVWGARPQGSPLSAIVLNLVSAPEQNTYAGPSGFIPARVQAGCWASTFLAARDAARLVRAAAKDIRGVRGGVRFDAAFVEGRRDDSEVSETDGRLYRRSVDLIVWHVEP